MCIISKKAEAYEIVKNSEWIQTFWDGASRNPAALTAFAVEILNYDMETTRTITLDCFKVVLRKLLEETIESII